VASPVSVQVLRGRVRIATDHGETDASTGALVTFGAGVRHGVHARSAAALLITMALG
jgi:quercetin dioxygenase-like cupin family protein